MDKNKNQKETKFKRRFLFLAAMFTLTGPLFSFVGGGISFDPIAKAQRIILIAE